MFTQNARSRATLQAFAPCLESELEHQAVVGGEQSRVKVNSARDLRPCPPSCTEPISSLLSRRRVHVIAATRRSS